MRVVLLSALSVIVGAANTAAQTIAITGGRVHPVSAPVIENGTVLIRDGRIVAVGSVVPIPADARRIDARGKIVTPGLVNGATELGLKEIGSTPATRDVAAQGRERVAAAFSVWEGLNPQSVLIPPARAAGITTVVVAPSGGLIAGQAAAVHLVEGGLAEMVLRAPVAMIGTIGDAASAGAGARAEVIVRLRELLEDARVYRASRVQFDRGDSRTLAASRLDLEALGRLLDGRLPLVLNVNKVSDIESALKLASDFKLRLIVAGAAEGWMVADKLAAAKVPVLTGAMNNIPNTFAMLGARQENAGLLRKAGVTVVVIGNAGGGDEEAFNVRNVRFEAGNAVAYGMAWEDALRAITLSPAEVFGIADRVGSLAAGKDADVVIWSGDPFEFATQPEHVFVRGRETTTPTRQDLLEARYKTLPPDYRRGPGG